jgi:hypothetical protein
MLSTDNVLALLPCSEYFCRSALISLSSVSDDTMRGAKAGAWWEDNAQRAMANNSAVYTGAHAWQTHVI